jgi:histidinol dehydrogenase
MGVRSWTTLLKHGKRDQEKQVADKEVQQFISEIIYDGEERDDSADGEMFKRFDNRFPESFRFSKAEIETTIAELP